MGSESVWYITRVSRHVLLTQANATGMMFLPDKARTITDDRGMPHVISWLTNRGDDAYGYLGRRIAAEFQESAGLRPTKRVSGRVAFGIILYVLVVAGVMMLMARASIPGSVAMFIWAALGTGAMFVTMRSANSSNRAIYQRAALMSVEEGVCGSCWYDVRGLPLSEDGMVVCPECRAAWLASRVRASAGEGGTSAEPLPKRETAGRQEMEAIERHLSLNVPTPVKDEQNRTYPLVRSRDLRLRAAQSEGATRDRYQDAARKLRSAGLMNRLGWSCLGFIVVGFMFVSGVPLSTPRLSQSLGDWVLWLLMLYAFVFAVLRGIGWYFHSDSVNPARAKSLLLGLSLCPSCGSSLSDIDVDAEGHTVCVTCGAAWMLAAPATVG